MRLLLLLNVKRTRRASSISHNALASTAILKGCSCRSAPCCASRTAVGRVVLSSELLRTLHEGIDRPIAGSTNVTAYDVPRAVCSQINTRRQRMLGTNTARPQHWKGRFRRLSPRTDVSKASKMLACRARHANRFLNDPTTLESKHTNEGATIVMAKTRRIVPFRCRFPCVHKLYGNTSRKHHSRLKTGVPFPFPSGRTAL